MKKQLIYLTVFMTGVLLFSCKKDKLEGEYAVLVGTWDWAYTTYFPDFVTPDTIWPNDKGHTYSMEFMEKGKVCFYQDGDKTHCDRVTIPKFEEVWPGTYDFHIDLDGGKNGDLTGVLWDDTIYLNTPPPYSDEDLQNGDVGANYYVKR